MPDEKVLLKKVRTYCDKKPSNMARLALALGYSSANTVRAWIDKARIPQNKLEEVERFFKAN